MSIMPTGWRKHSTFISRMHFCQRMLAATDKSIGNKNKFWKALARFSSGLWEGLPIHNKEESHNSENMEVPPIVLCWQSWLTRNKCIFKNQILRIGKTLSKTWGLTSEILNVKGTTPTDYSTLQQEEWDWLSKAIINNNGQKGNRKVNSGNIWKIRMSEEELTNWRNN